jgi:hypothetical protein
MARDPRITPEQQAEESSVQFGLAPIPASWSCSC